MRTIPEVYAGNKWWSRVIATATGNTDIKAPTAATANGRTRRLVVTGWQIVGHNTNAAATTFTVRNKTTTTSILFGGSMLPTTGRIELTMNGVEIPVTAGETIQLVVAGAITGQIEVTMWGVEQTSDLTAASNTTGAP